MNKYKTFEELKEELGNKFEEYMYKANIELLEKIDKAIEYIEENTTKDYQVPLIDSFSISYQKLIDILRGEE